MDGQFKPQLLKNFPKIALRFFWEISISLKFAVMVMIGLTACLIAATFTESAYDTPTAQYWIYQTWYFYALLGLLFWLILAVALSRLPWQKKHLPFLCAHLGILLLLYGSWMTFQFGVDGSLQVTEGRTESTVELNEPLFLISGKDYVKQVKVPWIPPNAKFHPISISEYGLRISQFISRSEPQVDFIPSHDPRELSAPAVRVKVAGGPGSPPFMRMGTEAWLWSGDQNWSRNQLGAATLMMLPNSADAKANLFPGQGPMAVFHYVEAKKGEKTMGKLVVAIQTSDGRKSNEEFSFADPKELVGKAIKTGWKFDAEITILDWIPRAVSDVTYVPSRVQYGAGAPPSAILVESDLPAAGDPNARAAKVWLGLGERATFDSFVGGKSERLTIGYFPRRIVLPFGVVLDRFQIERYQGSMNPSEFSSIVTVKAATNSGALPEGSSTPPAGLTISMNEPMKYGGYTFYQSSYVDAQPRPVTSIFSVNQDPGRWLKYLGSLLIVCGSIWLFAMKYVRKKGTP